MPISIVRARKDRPAPRLCRRWTPEADAKLIGFLSAGMSDTEAATHFPPRSRCAITQRRNRLEKAGRMPPRPRQKYRQGPCRLPAPLSQPERISPERERHMSRCRQLAAALASEGGCATWRGLLRAGWVRAEGLAKEGGAWFELDVMGVTSTGAGKKELLGAGR